MRHWSTTSRRSIRPGRVKRLLPVFFWSLRVIVLASFIAAGVWGWHWLKRPNLLPISNVAIQGNFQHVKQNTLETIINPYLTAGFFHLNITDLQQALLQMPWIDMVSVSRIWPNKMVIVITERQAMARWGKDALLDKQGTLFRPPLTSFPPGLPLLNGMDDQVVRVWQEYQQMAAALMPLHLRIVELDLTPRHSWSLVLSSGTRVLLGRLDVMQRLNHFIKLYPKLFVARINFLESVDLRYPNGMAIRWRDGES
ncbi:MAG: cell division protein FtsQ/DivIB [Gammaproteobacteria bacterium]